MERLTYQDAVDHVVDYVGGGLSDVVVRDAKKAVQAAYRDLFMAHNWTYLYKLGGSRPSCPTRRGRSPTTQARASSR